MQTRPGLGLTSGLLRRLAPRSSTRQIIYTAWCFLALGLRGALPVRRELGRSTIARVSSISTNAGPPPVAELLPEGAGHKRQEVDELTGSNCCHFSNALVAGRFNALRRAAGREEIGHTSTACVSRRSASAS